MIDMLKAAVEEVGPLTIERVNWFDPTLTVSGAGWSLALTCPWQITHGRSRLYSWDDPDVANQVPSLVGHVISEVRERSRDAPYDPAFVMSGSLVLEISADSDLDPWVLHLPGRTFVGLGPEGGGSLKPLIGA